MRWYERASQYRWEHRYDARKLYGNGNGDRRHGHGNFYRVIHSSIARSGTYEYHKPAALLLSIIGDNCGRAFLFSSLIEKADMHTGVRVTDRDLSAPAWFAARQLTPSIELPQ